MRQKIMGWQPEHFDNRYAFACGVIAYIWQSLLNIQSDIAVGMIKAALFGVAGMAGKELWGFIKKAYVTFKINRKIKKHDRTIKEDN
jgi:hypothetical protein